MHLCNLQNFGTDDVVGWNLLLLTTFTDWKLLSATKNVAYVHDSHNSHPFHQMGYYESEVTHLKVLGPNMLNSYEQNLLIFKWTRGNNIEKMILRQKILFHN